MTTITLHWPHVTEKTELMQAERKYTFIVASQSTKVDIAEKVESTYKTKVSSVRVIPIRKKVRLIGRTKWMTKRQARKKAIVTLKKGEKIDIMNFASEAKKEKKKTPVKEKK